MKLMDKITMAIVVFSIITGMIGMCRAAELALEWDKPPGDKQWGTKVFVGEQPGVYIYQWEAGIGTTDVTVENLIPGHTYYFAIKHYDLALGMESAKFSNEIEHVVPSGITVLPDLPPLDESVKEHEAVLRIKPVQ